MSIKSIQRLYSGGLESIFDKHMGGGKTLVIYSLTNNKKNTIELVVGDRCKQFMSIINMEWNAFLKNYWIPEKGVADIHREIFLNYVASLLGIKKMSAYDICAILPAKQVFSEGERAQAILPAKQVFSEGERAQAILKALNMFAKNNTSKFITSISNAMNLHDPISRAAQYLFSTWRTHIEQLLDKIICTSKKEAHIKFWTFIDNKYNIDTSSIILFSISPPAAPNTLPWLIHSEFTQWLEEFPEFPFICNIPEELLQRFMLAVKKWTYLGFCPKRPLYRLQRLFDFPLKELVDIINYMDKSATDKSVTGGAAAIIASEAILNKFKNLAINKKQKQSKMPKISINPIKLTNNDDLNLYEYVENYIDILDQIKLHLIENEKYFVEIANSLAKMNNIIVNAKMR